MKSLLQQALEHYVSTRPNMTVRDYSGRFMYGRRCLAVSATRLMDIMEFSLGLLGFAKTKKERQLLAEQIRDMRDDSLGLGKIYYWPNIPFVEEEKTD